jgi:hypothetical protein
MSFLNEVHARVAALGAGVYGSALIIGLLPDSPDLVTVLYETGGAPPNLGFNTPGLAIEQPGLQVVVRGAGADYAGPRTRIEAIYKDLCKVQGVVLAGGGTSALYHMMHPQQAPFLFNRDEKAPPRCLFAVNFLCEKEPSV